MNSAPTLDEILVVARRATHILQTDLRMSCCVFGGAAVHMWAEIYRIPGDVDIVVMNNSYHGPEDVKELIVRRDRRFYLVNSTNPSATYRILWYHLPSGRSVKVDILVPGFDNLDLPQIDDGLIAYWENVPVMPLFPLLLMKVQGWWHHRTSNRRDFKAKEGADIEDIAALLRVAQDRGEHLTHERGNWDQKFLDNGEFHVQKFMRIGYRDAWRALGFRV
ncbi:hypothetical protein BV25DRAFT_1826948 [Artomyces pyxidatus]|uniref:Uncharacterized protein n=1 Tax=Artomyces pyxidatus TaxID=48021 RepID=A0ACB8SXH0_9AGAM|nr:hypothetical protein BV25DRAFT_1826948 [Artomyces pyxidatus]